MGTAKNDRQVLVPGAVGETSAEAHSTNVLDYPSRMSENEKESLVAEALAPLTVPLVDNIKLFSIEFLNSLPSIGCLIAHSPILMALPKVSQCATHNRIHPPRGCGFRVAGDADCMARIRTTTRQFFRRQSRSRFNEVKKRVLSRGCNEEVGSRFWFRPVDELS